MCLPASHLPRSTPCALPCRYDQLNVRLRLAIFNSPASARFRLVSLAPTSPAGSAGEAPRGVYRGPALEPLQPGGMWQAPGGEAAGPRCITLCRTRPPSPAA